MDKGLDVVGLPWERGQERDYGWIKEGCLYVVFTWPGLNGWY